MAWETFVMKVVGYIAQGAHKVLPPKASKLQEASFCLSWCVFLSAPVVIYLSV